MLQLNSGSGLENLKKIKFSRPDPELRYLEEMETSMVLKSLLHLEE
jgi:hypothetical protein